LLSHTRGLISHILSRHQPPLWCSDSDLEGHFTSMDPDETHAMHVTTELNQAYGRIFAVLINKMVQAGITSHADLIGDFERLAQRLPDGSQRGITRSMPAALRRQPPPRGAQHRASRARPRPARPGLRIVRH